MLKAWLRKGLSKRGYQVIREPDDLEPAFQAMRTKAAPYTGSPIDKMYSLFETVRYVAGANIAGDFVECGVGAGGSSVLAALAMTHFGSPRKMWLYDTFAGMPEPAPQDKSAAGTDARQVWESKKDTGWFRFSLEQVKAAMATTGYDPSLVQYVEGKVEETIPAQMPARISILRLDTDFYESTLHELNHLYPRLSVGGVLYIDDYYAWQGAKQAVEEYFAAKGPRPMLTRLTSGARIGIKVVS